MKYVIGIDLGTSAVKTVLVDTKGEICAVVSKNYPLLHEKQDIANRILKNGFSRRLVL